MLREACFGALVAGTFVMTLLTPAGTALAASSSGPGLSTDATGPLVPGVALSPGLLPATCVVVSWNDLTDQDLGLDTAVTGGLADFVDVTVATGTGGRYGDCSGFEGSESYRGTLADLAREHGSAATALRSSVTPLHGQATFRFDFSLRDDNAAQGLSTNAQFTWRGLTPAAVAVPTPGSAAPVQPASTPPGEAPAGDPTPVESPTVTTTPQPPAPAEPPAGPPVASAEPTLASPPSGSPAATPRPARTPHAVVPGSPARPPRGRTTATVPLTGPVRTPPVATPRPPGNLLEEIAGVTAQVVQRAAFPVFLLLLVLFYLAAQDRIDRRDPKLALAPLHADPNLAFPAAGEWSTP